MQFALYTVTPIVTVVLSFPVLMHCDGLSSGFNGLVKLAQQYPEE